MSNLSKHHDDLYNEFAAEHEAVSDELDRQAQIRTAATNQVAHLTKKYEALKQIRTHLRELALLEGMEP